MTRDEAVEILEKLKPIPRRADGQSMTHLLMTEALDMAIKSLEQSEKYRKDYKRFKRKYLKLRTAIVDSKTEILSMFPHTWQDEYWDGYDSCRDDVIKVINKHVNEKK